MTDPLQQNPPDERKEERHSFGAYMAVLLSVPVVLAVAVLFLAGTNWFFHHSTFGMQSMGYSLTLHHADCQVVLTGDSSALTGLDPITVTRVTGLSACNVSEGAAVTTVTGSYPLDAYLEQNAPPKYMVFLQTPSLYTPDHPWQAYGSYNEGMVYLLHYEPWPILYRTLLKRPEDTYHFILWAIHTAFTGLQTSVMNPHKYDGLEPPMLRRERHGGMFTYYAAPETSCVRKGIDPAKIRADRTWPDTVRRKYGVNGTHVFVDVAPIPDCDDLKDTYRSVLAGLHDNALDVLPIGMFNNEDVHFTPEGAAHISAEVGEQILADERSDAARANAEGR